MGFVILTAIPSMAPTMLPHRPGALAGPREKKNSRKCLQFI